MKLATLWLIGLLVAGCGSDPDRDFHEGQYETRYDLVNPGVPKVPVPEGSSAACRNCHFGTLGEYAPEGPWWHGDPDHWTVDPIHAPTCNNCHAAAGVPACHGCH